MLRSICCCCGNMVTDSEVSTSFLCFVFSCFVSCHVQCFFFFSKCMQLCCVLTGAQVPHKCQSQHSSRGVLCWSRLLWPFLNLADSAIAFHSQVSWSISCDRSQCDDWGHCGWRTRARKLGTRLWQKQWQHSHYRCGLQGALEIIYSAVLQLNISSCHRKTSYIWVILAYIPYRSSRLDQAWQT